MLVAAFAAVLGSIPAAHAGTGPDPALAVQVPTGPYLVGQEIPIRITAANRGDVAEKVYVGTSPTSGSYLSLSGLGPLAHPGTTLAPGASTTVEVTGRIHHWQGVPVVRFSLYAPSDVDRGNNEAEVRLPFTSPDSGTGTATGLVYGDRDGDQVADPGEGLAGVRLQAHDGDLSHHYVVRTDAQGRYRFTGLPVRRYRLSVGQAPDGWVLPRSAEVDVDGNGEEYAEHRAVRPLSDRLGAVAGFDQEHHLVGDRARVFVTLTNNGPTDITGIKAGCDRSGGEGPHLVDLDVGDLAWDRPGVTVPAGQSRVYVISGTVPAKATGFGTANIGCDFGPDGDHAPEGYPRVLPYTRVDAPRADTWLVYYEDRDNDTIRDPDEAVVDLEVRLTDAISGVVADTARTDARGRVDFRNIPAGPYWAVLNGRWKYEPPNGGGLYVGTCVHCRGGQTTAVLPS
ncbi:hypothetical protein ABZ816_32945 [Actinosynnema sp. NPDC047251]|uniref:hypothetical protein n=1 Tax=Saccharothrix espanaensis TaxID=103731 RepID=UPI000688B271|nr:hypothetical protein [Saccharothrix espanaensis]